MQKTCSDRLNFKRKTTALVSVIARLIFFLGMAYVLLYPLLIMISKSVRSTEDLMDASIIWIPSSISFENFKKAIEYMNYGETFPYSVFIVLISTVLTLISCSMAGYAIGRYRLKISGICLLVCVLHILVPLQTYLIPYFFQMKYFNFWGLGYLWAPFNGGEPFQVSLLNSFWTYFLPALTGAGLRSGLCVLLFVQGFAALPQELEDAAKIDGCSHFGTFLRIMVPNMNSSYLVVFLLSVVWNWSEYYYPMMMMGNTRMLSTTLASLRDNVSQIMFAAGGLKATSTGELSLILYAAALLFVIPMLLMYIVLQRRFVEGMERTGIVG